MTTYSVLEVRDDGSQLMRTNVAVGALALFDLLFMIEFLGESEVIMVTEPYGEPDDGNERLLNWDEIAVISGYVRGCAATTDESDAQGFDSIDDLVAYEEQQDSVATDVSGDIDDPWNGVL